MKIPKRIIILLSLFSILSVSCSSHPTHKLQGYIEGEYIYISSKFDSVLTDMKVVRGQEVKRGDLLFFLESEPESDTLASAKDSVLQLQAELAFDKAQLERQAKLYPQNATDKASLDQASRDFNSKMQQLQSAFADLKKATWDFNHKSFFAPIDSQIVDIYYRIGERVSIDQPVLSLLAPSYIHVLFYIPETEFSKIHIGQTVSFTCDGCPGSTDAIVSYISPEAEYTPPIIYSENTRNKLVYLIRAEMPPAIAKTFHPGQPVDVLFHE